MQNPVIANPAALITASEVKRLLLSTEAFALLDVQEKGVFNQGHAFEAISASLSHRETRLPLLVPRKPTRIVLMDSGEEAPARRALGRIILLGDTESRRANIVGRRDLRHQRHARLRRGTDHRDLYLTPREQAKNDQIRSVLLARQLSAIGA